MHTNSDMSTKQSSTRKDMPGPRYSFKKRVPLPGAYPKNFSPYLLTNSLTMRAVQLTRTEIKNDVNYVQQAISKECCSQYFEEVTTAPECERVVDVTRQISSSQNTIQRRVPRKQILSFVQAPITEVEERKQLRAALKASLAERANEFDCLKLQTVDGARLLRDVCNGHIFRTG